MGEEIASNAITSPKSTQELAIEGRKHLEETIESAFQILSSMNDELCNPALWSTSSSPTISNVASPIVNGDHPSGAAGGTGGGGGSGALDKARSRYKTSIDALRAILTAIPNSQKVLL